MKANRMTQELHFRLLDIIDAMEREIVKPCVVDETRVVTNHMRAAWAARDAINAIFVSTTDAQTCGIVILKKKDEP